MVFQPHSAAAYRRTIMSFINDKKIAFISCVNQDTIFAECLYYLDQLIVPENFEKDVISIQDAPSMAAGYNAAMDSTDAKYKVYLHQDLHILNQYFISNVINIFQSDLDIGILGCIGTTNLGKEAMAVTSWNAGKVIQNCRPMLLKFDEFQSDYISVMALDGLLLATQYDIPWREDLMDGWDFYDISQCMEFARAGYKAVIPRQENAWCYHDSHSSNMKNYNHYRRRFIDEYCTNGDFQMPPEWEGSKEYQKMKQQTKNLMDKLIHSGAHEQMHKVFQDPSNRGFMHLRDYEIIADTDCLELRYGADRKLWQTGMDVSEILQRVQQLKYWMQRIEYQAVESMQMMDQILDEYSIFAVVEMFVQYVWYKEYTYQTIKKYFEKTGRKKEAALWNIAAKKVFLQS